MARMTDLRGAAGHEPSLLGVLGRMDEDALATLLRVRPDLLDPPPRNRAALAARAADPASVETCRQALDLGAQQVVEALCLLPKPAATGQLADLLGLADNDRDLADVLRRLCDRALVAWDGTEVRLLVKIAVRYPAGLGPPVAVALAPQPAPYLAKCALYLGVDPGRTKTDTLAAIAEALSDTRLLARLLMTAPSGAAEVARRLAFEGPEGYAPGATYAAVRSEETPVGWLVSRGILAPIGWDTVVLMGEAGL
ncbi:MAG: hypothetical protein QOE93_642, partial [Actinomycetota bacterium]|nr:hypothetical protein [Actinomycetota bacterium]